MKTWRAWSIGLALLPAAWPASALAQQDKQVVVYTSNESTLNSLVFEAFEKETGIKVQPVARISISLGSPGACRRSRA